MMLRSLVVILMASSVFGQQRCLRNAWTAVEHRDHQQAIAASEACIASSGTIAEADQRRLSESPVPQVGRIPDQATRNQVLGNWAINDVAAAHWIIATESEALYKAGGKLADLERAKRAYQDAMRFPHARVLDQQGEDCCFWAPANEAKRRLEQLPRPVTNSKRRVRE